MHAGLRHDPCPIQAKSEKFHLQLRSDLEPRTVHSLAGSRDKRNDHVGVARMTGRATSIHRQLVVQLKVQED